MKFKQLEWYKKLIIVGVLLIGVFNPLSLIFITSGIDVAVMALSDALQAGLIFTMGYFYVPVGIGALSIVLGIGVHLGARENQKVAKLKSLKNKKTESAGKYLTV